MESVGSISIIVSVILPIRNESGNIGAVLSDIASQDYDKELYEVIVVDGISEDNTIQEVNSYSQKFKHFSLLKNEKQLSSAARNLGVKHSQGKYIIFIDGHSQIESKTMLTDLVKLFETNDVDALCRPQPLTAKPMTFFQKCLAAVRSSTLGHGLDSTIYSNETKIVSASSAGAIYRREVFEKIGNFDEKFDAAEDVEFNTRFDLAGLKAMISPLLTIHYEARKNLPALFKQLFRYGVGRWRLAVKHPKAISLGMLIPPLFVLGIFLTPLLWILLPSVGLILSFCYALYLLLVITFSLKVALDINPAAYFIAPFIYLTIHVALGVGFLIAPFKRRK